MNPIAKEPVLTGALASIIVWLAGRYGLNVDPTMASAAAGAVLVIVSGFTRQLVTPTSKLQYKVEPPVEPPPSPTVRPAG